MTCNHDFSVPLFAQDEAGEWTSLVVGWACSKCWVQVFGGDVVQWTGTSNRTEVVSWSTA